MENRDGERDSYEENEQGGAVPPPESWDQSMMGELKPEAQERITQEYFGNPYIDPAYVKSLEQNLLAVQGIVPSDQEHLLHLLARNYIRWRHGMVGTADEPVIRDTATELSAAFGVDVTAMSNDELIVYFKVI